MNRIRIPVFQKLFTSFILCSILPLIIIGGLMYGFSLKFLNKTLHEQTMNSINTFHERLNSRISAYEIMITKIQNSLEIRDSLNSDQKLQSDSNKIYEIMYEAVVAEEIKRKYNITNLDGSIIFPLLSFLKAINPDYWINGEFSGKLTVSPGGL